VVLSFIIIILIKKPFIFIGYALFSYGLKQLCGLRQILDISERKEENDK
jgi:hypothetical protein